MLKPLSLSVSLAIALGACSLSVAGGHGKSMPTAQSIAPSSQSIPSAQSISEGCDTGCAPAKHKCALLSKFSLPKCEYKYEWVLKKKKVWHWSSPFGHKNAGCGSAACDSCGTTPSGQSYGSGQNFATTQIPATYSAPQGHADAPAMEPVPAMMPGSGVPAAPSIPTPPTAAVGGLNLLPSGN